jgi:hypothetical protein
MPGEGEFKTPLPANNSFIILHPSLWPSLVHCVAATNAVVDYLATKWSEVCFDIAQVVIMTLPTPGFGANYPSGRRLARWAARDSSGKSGF